jgi:hypothetical protein
MIMHGKDFLLSLFVCFLFGKSVLNNISEIGAFLIRPQLKKLNANDHEYVCQIHLSSKQNQLFHFFQTLSIYAFGGIIKYRILKLSVIRFSEEKIFNFFFEIFRMVNIV